jgi:hypothetical protein
MNSTPIRRSGRLRRLTLLMLLASATVGTIAGPASAEGDSVSITSPADGAVVQMYGGTTQPVTSEDPLVVTFAAAGSPVTCALDDQPASPCTSPVAFPQVSSGAHSVTVTAGTAVQTSRFEVAVYALAPPPEPPLVNPYVTARWHVADRRTWPRRLEVGHLGRHAQVKLSCLGRGCPSPHSTTRTTSRSVDLTGFLRGRALRPATRVIVRVARETTTTTSTYTIQRGRRPRLDVRTALAPNARSDQSPSRVAVSLPNQFRGTDLVITSVRSHAGVCSPSPDGSLQNGRCRAGRFEQGDGQGILQLIADSDGSRTVSRIGIWNVEPQARRITLNGVGSTRGYRVRYLAHGKDITRRVVAGTYRTRWIGPGAEGHIRLVITTRKFVRNGRKTGFAISAGQQSVTTAAGTEIMPGDTVTDVVESFPYDALPVLVQPA